MRLSKLKEKKSVTLKLKKYTVKIRGHIRILSADGKVLWEGENQIKFNNLNTVIARLLTNSLPNNGCTPAIIMYLTTLPASYSNFTWTASGTLAQVSGFQPGTPVNAYLVACFKEGSNSYTVTVAEAVVPYYPGQTVTIEWTWYVEDQYGVIYNLLNMSLSGTLSSVSISPSAYIAGTEYGTVLFVPFTPSSTATYSSISVTFTYTSTSNTTSSYTATFNFSASATLEANVQTIIPCVIEIT